jgi:hypothetical protein
MTGYTVHTGSTEKFSEGWDQIFSSGKGKKTTASKAKKSSAIPTTEAKKSTKTAKDAKKRS